jgi:colanic acid/amylovoran biosynthesis protein
MRLVRELDLEPVLVIHEANDRQLANQLAKRVAFKVPVIDEDARTSKGMIGASAAVIGSRYHALVSALAQGVPSLATSWSHKYESLFADYDCADHVVALAASAEHLDARVRAFLDPEARQSLRLRLLARAREQREQIDAMWSYVEALLFPELARGDAT